MTPHLRIGRVLTLCALVAILFATLLPDSGEPVSSHLCLVCGSFGGVDVLLNVLLFIPLGVGLAMSGVPWRWAVLVAIALSATVETAQLFIPGRDATLGDVITNTVGGAVGFALARHAQTLLRPAPRVALILVSSWSVIWLAIQTASSFAFVPSIRKSDYYGEIASVLGNYDVFRGRVLDARIDQLAITDSRLSDGDSIGRRIRVGAAVTATVIPAGPTRIIAPILRVADAEQEEIVLLAQDERSLVFRVSTGAAILRFRPPSFALPRVFPGESPNQNPNTSDTLALAGRYLRDEVRMGARSSGDAKSAEILLTPSLGWTLVLPSQWLITGTLTERALGWLWIALLALPIGAWGSYASRRSSTDRVPMTRTHFWLAAAGILILGMGVVPILFAAPLYQLGDWIAALAGMISGARLSVLLRERTPSKQSLRG